MPAAKTHHPPARTLSDIPLEQLHVHPHNANVMPARLFARLKDHIAHSGCYPPIIVRTHPTLQQAYEILDGHHRVRALRELGHVSAVCDDWGDVDDGRASIYLLTLNRLEGADDPLRRAALLANLRNTNTLDRILRTLPDPKAQVDRLLALHDEAMAMRVGVRPTPVIMSPDASDMPHPITFFLSAGRLASLRAKLRAVGRNRNEALATLLQLDEQPTS